MRKHLGQAELPVFTATFPGTNVDEGTWAKQAADFNHAHQFEVTPTAEELIRDLGELMFAQDIPIWSTSTYAQFRVMKLVKEQGIRVVLDGQGGDEIFGGYDPHRYFYLKGQTPISGIDHVVNGNLSFFLRQYLRFDGVPSLPTSIQHKINLSYFKDLSFIQPDFITEQFRHIDLRQNPESHGLNERLSWEMQNHTLKSYLKCEDRCAMWHSVESRTPFADDFPLIEYVFGLPADLKFDGARLKTLLREASSSVMPEAIKKRSDKQGYTTPNRAWLSKIAPEMSEVFSDALGDIFQVEKIRAEYSNLLTNKALNDDGRLFKYLSFAIWHREFVR
jgi:asparagine synthase (glutamine-hydrolysing)